MVHDLFHIVAKYGLEVIDRVRVDETDRLAKAADPGPVRTARRFRTDWRRRALPSRIPVLRMCTAMRERHHDRIRRHCRFPINSGVLEGCDDTIKGRKRVAYGHRGEASFLPRIGAARPAISG